MALPGCLAELLANFLEDFVADVPKFLSPSKLIRAQFRVHCRPQNPLSARQKQTNHPRKPCPETEHQEAGLT